VMLVWEGKVGRSGCDGTGKGLLTCRNISSERVNACFTVKKIELTWGAPGVK
jgi:hypothetical protein